MIPAKTVHTDHTQTLAQSGYHASPQSCDYLHAKGQVAPQDTSSTNQSRGISLNGNK